MARKKSNKRMYFTQTTENAIIRYNNTDDPVLKNKIYNDHIAYPFDKLAENIIHTFKFYYFDVPMEHVKHEVVSFLVENIHKFKEGKGKAFSYFSIVAKNYLILHNNKNYQKMKSHDEINKLDYLRNIFTERSKLESSEVKVGFVDEMIAFWELNLPNIFKRQKDILVADSVLELFRNRINLDNFNRKALYILIREMTGSNTQHITRVLNVMRKYHTRLYEEFYKYGRIDTTNTGSMTNQLFQ